MVAICGVAPLMVCTDTVSVRDPAGRPHPQSVSSRRAARSAARSTSPAGMPHNRGPPAETGGTMSSSLFPEDGSRIEMEAGGDIRPGVRVVAASTAAVTVSLPPAHVPRAGSTVILRWSAAPRGRYVVSATVAATEESRAELRLAGRPEIVQNRLY